MYDLIKVGVNASDNKQNAAFLAEVFNNRGMFTEEYIKWQYDEHPLGRIIGYNALMKNKIAAHFVLQPFPAIINGVKCKGLLSFNSATKKEHQGKGLFMMLATKTIDEVIAEGYEFIVAVTNYNSVHAYTKRLGFQLVCQLEAKMGLGKVFFKDDDTEPVFKKFWNDDLLKWRLSNPLKKYFFVDRSGYYSKTHLPLIKAFLLQDQINNSVSQQSFGWRPLTLYIGLNPNLHFKGSFFNIPEKLKPSPLFLVYRDLRNGDKKLDKEKIKFDLIDFDAY